jgi:hypothetical protein
MVLLGLMPASSAGVVADRAGEGVTVYQPSIAFDGTSYLVVWTDAHYLDRIRHQHRVLGARVSPGGRVRDQDGFRVAEMWTPPSFPTAKVAFGGSNHLVVWNDYRSDGRGRVYGSRVSPRGTVLDPDSLRLTALSGLEAASPAIAFDGRNYLVVWPVSVYRSGETRVEILGVLVNSTGEALTVIHISPSQAGQGDPVVAFDGTNYLVAWAGGCARICGARVSPSGIVLDGAGIPISAEFCDELSDRCSPAIAFDGMNYLVLWTDPRGLYGSRISRDGGVLDPGGIRIGRGGLPAVAFDGANYLVAWEEGDSSESAIYGARVSPSGRLLDPAGFRISTAPGAESAPAVAFDGTHSLVVWTGDSIGSSRAFGGVFGARVNSAGRVLDRNGIVISSNRCNVPRVIGLRLATAKARIRSANCRLGVVRRSRSRRAGRVLAQSPRAGASRPRGTRVNLVIGVPKRRT